MINSDIDKPIALVIQVIQHLLSAMEDLAASNQRTDESSMHSKARS